MAEEWGPWIEHDGRGCPLPSGTVVQVVFEEAPGDYTRPLVGVVQANGGYSWDWRLWGKLAPDGTGIVSRIIRYRVRKPRALAQLRDMVESLPAPESEVA